MNQSSEVGSSHALDRSRMLPIAEVFSSLQGEGRWVGTPMRFIRLAGCSVGRSPERTGPIDTTVDTTLPILKTGASAWLCHTYDGRPFWCDTDFGLKEWVNFASLLDDTWERHICLTGGEPLTHEDRLHPFIDEAAARGIRIHVETSGTIEVCFDPTADVWISVSPKLGVLDEMIEMADEIKLLVDGDFDLDKVPHLIRNHPLVYVQPINEELSLNRVNFERCMRLLHIMPEWHISVQTHKLLNLR